MKTILPRPRRHARRVAAAARWGGGAGGAGTMRARPGWARPQLAIEYAHRFAADYALVWWIDAEQPVLIADQLVRLAERLGLHRRSTVTDTLERLLADLARRPRWLLVFDNAESPLDIASYQ